MKKRIDAGVRGNRPTDDPDAPELSAEMIRSMRPLRDFPDLHRKIMGAVEAAHAEKRMRGRPKLEHPKVQVTLRLDDEVVNSFKEDGPGWQGRINETLKKVVRRRRR